MGRQLNQILADLSTITSGTSVINVNLADIEALVTTIQADIADGIISIPSTSTSGGTGPTTFTSTSYGTIAASNASRKGLIVYNEGGGNLHITIGTATTSTSSFTVRLSAGDYYELPFAYTGLVGGIFATAGTARVTQII